MHLLLVAACAPPAVTLASPDRLVSIDVDGTKLDGDTIVTTTAFGREDAAPVAFHDVVETAGRVELQADALTEWWTPQGDGFEQGWNVAARTAGSGPLHVSVTTSLPVSVASDGLRIGSLWRVSDAVAVDRDGNALPTKLEAVAGGFRVVVDDDGAAYPIVIDPIYTTSIWTYTGTVRLEEAGTAVGSGDYNGDGLSDLAVGAAGATSSYTNEGAVRIYDGAAGGAETTASATVYGAYSSAGMGGTLASGDVTGDGYDDIIAGAPYADKYASNAGFARLFLGSASGISSTVSWTYSSSSADSWTGTGIDAGDLDGDGFEDVAVGIDHYGSYAGRVVVFYGSASGLATTPDVTIDHSGTYEMGSSVAMMQDADGDGMDELMMGDNSYDGTYSNCGRVFVHYGDAAGISTTADTTLYGGGTDYRAGYRFADGGDTNGDGYGDAIVDGLYYTGFSLNNYGRFYIYEGSATGYGTAADVTISGSTTTTRLAFYGLAGAVDIDGDGFDDVAANASNPYAMKIYYGSATGVTTTGAETVSFTSITGFSGLIGGIAGVEDSDDDGFAEFLIGDYGYDGPTGTGYEYYGWVGLYGGHEDADGDGAYAGAGGTDCDDTDSSVKPGATEIVADGIDQDCDGDDACYLDSDHDTYGSTSTVASSDADCTDAGEAENDDDCNDSVAAAHPGGTETTGDGVDGDCNGAEVCFKDNDRDTYGSTTTVASTDLDCADAGEADDDDDCSDSSSTIHPGAAETTADGVDQDCDSGDTCYTDSDADSYGSTTTRSSADLDCTDASEANDDDDCNDASSAIHPGGTETVADGIDQDCDSGDTCYSDSDGDTYGGTSTKSSTDLDCIDSKESSNDDDCDDTSSSIYPGAAETPGDGVDADCDDTDRCYDDHDGDGYGSTKSIASSDMDCTGAGESATDDDCADSDKSAHPGATEIVADGLDQDCDEADSCYVDEDHDGVGSSDETDAKDYDCADSGESAATGDCDDLDRGRYPGNTEILGNGVDEDCDGKDGCYEDKDGDGVGGSTPVTAACGNAGTSWDTGDCDDNNADINPTAFELCNEIDDDCDGTADEDAIDQYTWYLDDDGDGYGTPDVTAEGCEAPMGYDGSDGDCDDNDKDVNPDAYEDCEATSDLNCDGLVGDEDDECGNGGSPDDSGFVFDGPDANSGKDDDNGGICGCASTPSEWSAGWMLLAGVAVVRRRRVGGG